MFNDYVNVLKAEEKKQREAELKNLINTFANSAVVSEWYKQNHTDMSAVGDFQNALVQTLMANNYELWNQLVTINKQTST
jgi:hypothetical protein